MQQKVLMKDHLTQNQPKSTIQRGCFVRGFRIELPLISFALVATKRLLFNGAHHSSQSTLALSQSDSELHVVVAIPAFTIATAFFTFAVAVFLPNEFFWFLGMR